MSEVRELFIEELEEVTGGAGPDSAVLKWLKEQLQTTHACGEEGPDC